MYKCHFFFYTLDISSYVSVSNANNRCKAVPRRSWPSKRKLKQMLGEEKGLLLHNGDAVLRCGTRVSGCSVRLKKSRTANHTAHDVRLQEHETPGWGLKIGKMRRKVIMSLRKRRLHFMSVCQIQALLKDAGDNDREEKHAWTKK